MTARFLALYETPADCPPGLALRRMRRRAFRGKVS